MTEIIRPSLNMVFSGSVWGSRKLRTLTNCYAYALNNPRTGFLQPGNLSKDSNLDVDEALMRPAHLRKLLIDEDGLREISENAALDGSAHAIALKILPGEAYHFYRKNHGGDWSHKSGPKHVSITDDKNRPITNPAKAATAAFPELVGYFTIPASGVLYTARLDVPDELMAQL